VQYTWKIFQGKVILGLQVPYKSQAHHPTLEEDSGESVKSEDREQFNSFQENCDEVVQMEC
jgi:hypothetical protein